jgi:tRNA(Arg) A34 adenosine deaminase TadA
MVPSSSTSEVLSFPKDTILLSAVLKPSRVFYEANKYSIHAEQACINKCKNKNKLRECTLILVRLNKKGDPVDCKPCTMCQGIINKYGVRKVVSIVL